MYLWKAFLYNVSARGTIVWCSVGDEIGLIMQLMSDGDVWERAECLPWDGESMRGH